MYHKYHTPRDRYKDRIKLKFLIYSIKNDGNKRNNLIISSKYKVISFAINNLFNP